MFSRYRHEIDNARAHVASLWAVIALLAALLAWALHGWSKAPERLTLHIPPDLSRGAVLRAGEVPKPNVYAFAFYMWQQINRWPDDGQRDYPKNLYAFQAYLTPRFRAELLRQMKERGRHGELSGRVRALHALSGAYEETLVERTGPDTWTVRVDALIEETVAGLEVKRTPIRYWLRVIRYEVDPEANPWGLALDGFARDPVRIRNESDPTEQGGRK